MSALGQKRTLKRLHTMSTLPPKADIVQHNRDVRFVPIADIRQSSRPFDGNKMIGCSRLTHRKQFPENPTTPAATR
jgi:hypothetical protein